MGAQNLLQDVLLCAHKSDPAAGGGDFGSQLPEISNTLL